MAIRLPLRLRRAIVANSAAAPFLRSAASTSISQPLSLAPFFPVPHPLPRPWLHPGAAAGFRSTAAAAEECKINPEEIPANGVDYKHWLITMRFPDPNTPREQMIETYLQTLAKIVGSYEEAKRRMYAFSTTTYTGFQATMTREVAERFYELPGVAIVLPDGYLYPEKREYGGDKYDNGIITPLRPRHYWGKSSRPDKNHTFKRNNQNSPSPRES